MNWHDREDKLFNPSEAPQTVDGDSDALLTHRVFSSRDGQLWLKRQRELKFETSIDPNASVAALRHLEGQRQLLRDIERLMREAERLMAVR
jgi:hypothetical protein